MHQTPPEVSQARTEPEAPKIVSARPEMTRALMQATGLDEAMLHDLVHGFYAKVRADVVLGPIFEERITDWGPHLERMVAFWSSVALMTGRYHGAPVPAHVGLPVRWAHFERWLALFRETAREICPPAGADHVIARAERIARSLNMAVEDAARTAEGGSEPQIPSLNNSRGTTMTANAAADTPPDESGALTEFIERRYHQRHRAQLPELAALAERIESVHQADPSVPEGLSGLLRQMIGEMEVHMKKEELILFPAIRRGGMKGIEAPIAVMRADHDNHEREVGEIRRLTGDLTLPEAACGSWTALYAGLDEFITDLAEHMRLENDVLFPRFEPEAHQAAG